jgi:1-acyl-sn-glycerol-3-phosphate acyltransferase
MPDQSTLDEGMPRQGKSLGPIPPSRRLLSLFFVYLHWYIGRHFHAVRLANSGRFPRENGPLIVYSNHPSWWDPLVFFAVSRYLLPNTSHYGPMDAAALKHYGFFRKFGMFPVESGTQRGAVQFLRATQDILAAPNSALWLTPEGRFTDMRTRPAMIRPGLGAVIARSRACTVVPLAVEYTFWNERLPEILLCCGKPIEVSEGRIQSAEEWSAQAGIALTDTQNELAALAMLRDASRFETVLTGRIGISGVYEAWKRLCSLVTGRTYQGSHGSIRGL